jgi:hypothetical protein
VAQQRVDIANTASPANATVASASRTWNDANSDFVPQESELGPLSPSNFGQPNITTTYDPAVTTGFGSRPYNWEISAGVQHELLPRVSLDAVYFRRWFGNFTVTDNLSVAPADYDPYCITAPVDSRLPGGGGNQICGLYDVNPTAFVRPLKNQITFADKFGKYTEVYNGVDVNTSIRLQKVTISGGLNTGTSAVAGNAARSVTSRCFVVDSPQELRFCDNPAPWRAAFKLSASLRLPWAVEAAGTFQTSPGNQITATYTATNAQILPSLGRNLAAGAGSVATVELIQPGTMFNERLYQVDSRLGRVFTVGSFHAKGMIDLYNVLNANTILQQNNNYGPAWLRPTYILPGRLVKFGVQLDF